MTWNSGRRDLVLLVGMQLMMAAFTAGQLLLGKRLLSQLLNVDRPETDRHFVPIAVLLVVVSIGLTCSSVIQTERARLLGERATRYAQNEILRVSSAVHCEAFESAAFFDVLQRAQLHGEVRPFQMTMGVLGISSSLTALGGIVAALVAIQPVLAPMLLLGSAGATMLIGRVGRMSYRYAYELTPDDRVRHYLSTLLVTRSAAKEIRAYDLDGVLRARHDELYERRLAVLGKLARNRERIGLMSAVMGTMALSLTLGAVAYLHATNRTSLSSTGIAIAALVQLATQIRTFATAAGSLYESALFLQDYVDFVQYSDDPQDPPQPAEHHIGSFESVELRDVTYRYPGAVAPSVKDVSLTLAKGDMIAIVGENGSGKTTLAKLIAQLHAPTAGTILWNGIEARRLDAWQLRNSVAVVFQDYVRFLLSARDNIYFGRTNSDDGEQRIVAAAHRAGAHEFLSALPGGYDTVLAKEFPNGSELSMGEWQRVAVARAIFRDASLIILDEPSASLDPRAESELISHLRTVWLDKAVVIISHRLSTVRAADRIYVMDGGEIVEAGAHEELMACPGGYAEMFSLQAAYYRDTPVLHR